MSCCMRSARYVRAGNPAHVGYHRAYDRFLAVNDQIRQAELKQWIPDTRRPQRRYVIEICDQNFLPRDVEFNILNFLTVGGDSVPVSSKCNQPCMNRSFRAL